MITLTPPFPNNATKIKLTLIDDTCSILLKAKVLQDVSFKRDMSYPGITETNFFLSIPHTCVGGKHIFISTDVFGNPGVYHPFTHIGHKVHL